MVSKIHVDIVSAEKEIFSGSAVMVVATGTIGEIGIVPGHSPLLTVLKPGELRLTTSDGVNELFYVSGGMLEVQPHCVTVLADEAERADSLDEAKALKAQEKAKEALANRDADFDYSKASAELARAAAQIAAIQKLRKNMK